ncbi:MAG: hypothetical protein ACPL1D_00720 [Microgenomates group bacterium]
MKKIGLILIIIGCLLFLIMIYNFIKEKNKMISPVPEEKGVRVIFITPEKQK